MRTLVDIGLVKDAAWRRPCRSTTSEAKRVQDAMNERRFNHELEVLGLQWLSACRASDYVSGEHAGKEQSPCHADDAVGRCDEAPFYVRPEDDLAPPSAMGCEDTKVPAQMGIGRGNQCY